MGIFNKGIEKAKKNDIDKLGVILQSSSASDTTAILWKNDAIDICAKACAICWDKPVPSTVEGKVQYLMNRAKTGHTSIFEHSNFVIYMEVRSVYDDDLIELLSSIRYLDTSIVTSKRCKNVKYLLIGGSYAGYLHLYRNIKNLHNKILNRITKLLYSNGFSASFEEPINDGIMDRESFAQDAFWGEPNEWNPYIEENIRGIDVSEHIYIENVDSIKGICTALTKVCPEYYLFDITDILKMVTCTVLFKDMSRAATHQLVRHRDAITQESQRYVDYTNACFNSPAMFKPDKYDKNHKYHIQFGGKDFEMTLEEIGLAEQGIYHWLRDPALAGEEYHLLKEDARAFLPTNIACRKLYMTFTYKMLIKFLELREDPCAQAENRLAAIELGKWFRDYIGDFLGDKGIYEFTKPYYKIEFPAITDDGEVISPSEDDSWVTDVIETNPEFKDDN